MPQAAIRQYDDEDLHTADVEPEAVIEAESEEEVSVESPIDEKQQDGTYYHYTVDTKDPDPFLVKHRNKLISSVIFLVTLVVGFALYKDFEASNKTKLFVAEPKVNDIYYIDYRVLQDNLRPNEKYRMAKVNDITGDVITINFSSYFYLQEHELNEAIRYAQLRFEKFFQERRHNFKISELQEMIESGAIVLARRPDGNVLDGNIVVPDSQFASSSMFIPGKKENFTGLEHLKFAKTDESRAEEAYYEFQDSADLGYPAGQVSLAMLYLTGTGVEKDLYESLSWLKAASLQSYEPAILKYAIVCQQVESCMIADFYDELIKQGVNIEFTKQANVRATTKDFERALKEAEEKKSIKARR